MWVFNSDRIEKMQKEEAVNYLNEESIRNYLNNAGSIGVSYSETDQYIKAAVLVPLLQIKKEWHLLYTRRTEKVNSHKGQVSFPGGSRDDGDLCAEDTALREAKEEIGLEKENVRILGRLNTIKSISRFIIIPVVARIITPYDYRISEDEVSRVFTIPLSWLVQKENYQIKGTRINGNVYEDIVFYKYYENELLWGLTARITLDFLQQLELI